MVVFTGTAGIVDRADVASDTLVRFAAKYGPHLPEVGMTRDEFEREYSATIRFTPDKVRGW